MKALKISTDNEITIVDVEQPLYEGLRSIIDGYLECVNPRGLPRPYVMIVDEEGLLKEKAMNLVGSVLYETFKHGSPIVGDIVIMREEHNYDGTDFAGLTAEDTEELTQLAREILEKTISWKGGEIDEI